MNIVNNLVSQISTEARTKLSEFLGESLEKSTSGLEVSLKAVLLGLVDIVRMNGSADSISKVIKDGGHSGDLLDDISNLFGKKDKLQLLVTIGKNINTHFFQSDLDSYAKDLAVKNGISTGSAHSLLSLSAPLVLGKLGKNIKTNNWTNDQLAAALLNEGEIYSLGAPAPRSTPQEQESKPLEIQKPITNTPEEKVSSKDENLGWLAWLFLAFLSLGALYYTFKGRIEGDNSASGSELSSAPLSNQMLPDSSAESNADEMFDALNTDRNKTDNPVQITEPQTTDENISPGSNRDNENNSSPSSPSTGETASGGAANGNIRPQSPSASYPSRNNTADLPPVTSSDNRAMSSKLETGDFFGINGLTYKYGSAEIVSEGKISELIRYLQANPSSTIIVKGGGENQKIAEDRAYALKDLLYQKGISSNRVRVSPQKSPDEPVSVRINS